MPKQKTTTKEPLEKQFWKAMGILLKNIDAAEIQASPWFMSRNRSNDKFKNRPGDIPFINVRNLGHLVNRRTRELSNEDINQISSP